MATHICPRCKAELNSINALNYHALQAERCFAGTWDAIADKLQSSILKTTGQVEFLLKSIPSTRGSDNFLWEWHKVIFQHVSYYDKETKSFKPKPQKEGIELNKLKFQIKQDSLGRPRRKLQEQDRKLYHRKSETGEWVSEMPHDCILPSVQVSLKRDILAEEYRRYYGLQSVNLLGMDMG